MTKSRKPRPSGKEITPADVARIQGVVSVANGGATPKGSYVGRMQRRVAIPPKSTE